MGDRVRLALARWYYDLRPAQAGKQGLVYRLLLKPTRRTR